MSSTATLTISHIGHQGDGLATTDQGAVSVPFTLAGEEIRAEITSTKDFLQGRLVEVLKPSPARTTPPCPAFGTCGGCRMQHMNDDTYRDWKRDVVNHLLEKNGFAARVESVFITPPASRRRVTFAVKKEANGTQIGFHMRESHTLVDIRACPVLKPQLAALIEPLRTILNTVLETGQQLAVHATLLNGAIEIVLSGISFNPAHIQQLISWGAAHGLARLYARSDENAECSVLLEQTALRGHYGGHDVTLPPNAFMQASDEAEAAMLSCIKPHFEKSKSIVDLFCGTGLFALNLYSKTKTMQAVDVDGAAINALQSTAQTLRGFTTQRRNLFREPLKAIELKNADAVCLDPPRAGAKEQAAELARSKVQSIAYVSCNPTTFMRDARMLTQGGYTLTNIHVFDQFLWSHHIELIALFSR